MTLEELYNKVMSDRDIMAEFVKASGTDKLTDFAKQYDCPATDREIRDYFIAKASLTMMRSKLFQAVRSISENG